MEAQSSGTSESTPSNLAEALRRMDNPEHPDESASPQTFPSEIKVPLSRLFDYTSEFWTQGSPISTSASFEEELAVWDLLDMDADGEEDPEFGRSDDFTGSVFTS